MNSHNNSMMKKKPRTVTASDHDYADGAALTLLFGNEHILLHLSCSSCCPYLTFVRHVLSKEAAHSPALMCMPFPATRIIEGGELQIF